MKKKRQRKSEGGITLIALVVTIIILLILAGVTLALALSDGGLIDKTKQAIAEHEKAQEKEKEELGKMSEMVGNLIDGLGEQTPTTPPTEDDRPLVSTVTDTTHTDNKKVKDSLGNPLVVPSGFKHKEGTNVEDGIVIEDSEGNEFVWIPVSNIDGDNNVNNNDANDKDLIIKKDGTKVEITLGRYTFKNEYNGKASLPDGTPEIVQKGSESDSDGDEYKFGWTNNYGDTYGDFKENTSLTRTNGGVGAKNLAEFITSVQTNHGYYLARYEAGKGDNGKPISKVGVAWTSNTIQAKASEAAQKMYEGEEKYTSDLVNSYAWDTAIVYIQAMGNENYANKKDGNGSEQSTGETGDEKCHIFDMAGNVQEWTTEYSTFDGGYGYTSPCVARGGYYILDSEYTANRTNSSTNDAGLEGSNGFRVLLYLK